MKNNTYMYALLLSVTLNVTAYTQEPPVLTSVSPASGFDSGGISVTILGSNFQNDVILTFGGSAAVNLVRLDSTSISAETPAHPAGIVDVIVTNSDGQADTLFNGFEYNLTIFGPPTNYATKGAAGYLFSAELDGMRQTWHQGCISTGFRQATLSRRERWFCFVKVKPPSSLFREWDFYKKGY